jgi:hypothetical protein
VRNVVELRYQTGAHIVLIHHGTRAGGTNPRGHSSLSGADDVQMDVVKHEDGSRTATLAHAKDDADGAVLPFRLNVVDLGPDEDEDPITTLICEEINDAPIQTSKKKLSDSEKNAMRAFDSAVRKAAAQPGLLNTAGDAVGRIELDQWRAEFYATCEPGAEPDAKRQAFYRVVKSLTACNVVRLENDTVWRSA